MRFSISVAVVAAILVACGGDSAPITGGGPGGGGNTCTSTSTAVTVQDNSFSPSCTTVAANSTITWTWGANASNGHNVTFPTGPNSATESTNGFQFQRTFPTAGTFTYLCSIHGAGMSGRIIVQ